MSRDNLIVLSDVHLGSDLVQFLRPDAPRRGKASLARDRELTALLDWYRERREGGRPWRLVIAGDFVDFVGMSVDAESDEIQTELSDEEREHGLGSAVDHTLIKLRRVAREHAEVFQALARFIAAGNTLVVVRGNHDVDLHWEPVQAAFRRVLEGHADIRPAQVQFADWFYYEEGRVFIEHGHQYDDFCSYDNVLFPVLPSDPKRSTRSLSDILLRYVVRPTRGMLESGHDQASAVDYLRFGAQLGVRGMLALGQRFVYAVVALLALWREHVSDAAAWVRQEHERKMLLLAEARQLSVVKLRALASLQRPPITRSVLRLLAGVMIDRVVMALLLLAAVVWLLVARWTPALGMQLAAALALIFPLGWLWRRARGAIDASDALRERAERVATLFPAAFIVMGHTHLPEVRSAAAGSTYVNLGAWAEEEMPEGAHSALPATRTHLVVVEVDGKPTASLLSWDSARGPERFVSTA
ncbi:MAG: metallophosphoesterase [Myxococcales bacterium]|nr:metallophosphoesterase [Myxococcales bacterium]MCB9578340.1 metallophosphoesterase [Polyangiaceae bacterium]